MNRSRIVSLGLALLCITSIAVVGTTLDSSLTTDPADEIDLNYDRLPIGASDAATFREDVESRVDENTATEQQPQAGSTGSQATLPTLLERLLALLAAIVRVLVPFGAVVGLIVVIYRYRERLSAILRTATTTDDGKTGATTTADAWPGTEPSNAVDLAWLWMVSFADPERPGTKTPGECATIAREAGIDPSTVEAITDAFERVHYGGVPVERETPRARAALEQLPSDGRHRSDGDRRRHQESHDGCR